MIVMSQMIIHILVVLVATIAGSSVGLGGGVVIKPLLDMFTSSPTATINFYSSVAVFTMAVVSVSKQIKQHFKFDKTKLFSVAAGAVIGGIVGQNLLQLIIRTFSSHTVRVVQSVLLFITLLLVLLYSLNRSRLKSFHVSNVWIIIILGFLLGTLSVFLGIGGGPINVAAMMLLFSFDMKASAVYSVGIIFFSQITKLIMVCLPGHHVAFTWPLMISVIISAVIGGYIGTLINRKFDSSRLSTIYNVLIGILLLVTLVNVVRFVI